MVTEGRRCQVETRCPARRGAAELAGGVRPSSLVEVTRATERLVRSEHQNPPRRSDRTCQTRRTSEVDASVCFTTSVGQRRGASAGILRPNRVLSDASEQSDLVRLFVRLSIGWKEFRIAGHGRPRQAMKKSQGIALLNALSILIVIFGVPKPTPPDILNLLHERACAKTVATCAAAPCACGSIEQRQKWKINRSSYL